MNEPTEIPKIDIFAETVLSTVEKSTPDQAKNDDFRNRVLSGEPNMVYGKCGYAGSVDVAQRLTKQLLIDIKAVTSGYEEGGNGHMYLHVENDDIIIDATAGQFIPKSSRQGFEKFFKGNMFVGERSILKEICMNGVINTSTQNDPELSFNRIWGEASKSKMGWE
jgi:hypothetical protein